MLKNTQIHITSILLLSHMYVPRWFVIFNLEDKIYVLDILR